MTGFVIKTEDFQAAQTPSRGDGGIELFGSEFTFGFSEDDFEIDLDTDAAIQEARDIALTFGPDDDHEKVVKSVLGTLEKKGLTAEVDNTYEEVLLPMTEEWGVVVLEGRKERLSTYEAMSSDPGFVEDIDAPDPVNVDRLIQQNAVIIEGVNAMELLSPEGAVIKATRIDEVLDSLRPELDRARDIGLLLNAPHSVDLTEARLLSERLRRHGGNRGGDPKSGIVTQPHKTWQDVNAGAASAFPAGMEALLFNLGFTSVSTYVDGKVSIDLFKDILARARQDNLSVWYHQGHGSVNKIYVTPKYPGPYITDKFVLNRGDFPDTLIYVYACATLARTDLADAFVSRGASTYCGWTWLCKARATVADAFDRVFWDQLVQGSDVGAGVAQVHDKGLAPYDLRGREADFKAVGNHARTLS